MSQSTGNNSTHEVSSTSGTNSTNEVSSSSISPEPAATSYLSASTDHLPSPQPEVSSNPVISAPVPPTSVHSPAESPPLLVRADNTHPMCTRAKAGIIKPRLQPTLLLTHAEPKSTKSALSNPTWHAAMKTEYDALLHNNT